MNGRPFTISSRVPATWAEAIGAYVERELTIFDGIERSRTDVREGRVVPHGDEANKVQAIVAAARAGR